jgi:hypothetical protein
MEVNGIYTRREKFPYGKEAKCIQNLNPKTSSKGTTWGTRCRWKDNIKINIKETVRGEVGC